MFSKNSLNVSSKTEEKLIERIVKDLGVAEYSIKRCIDGQKIRRICFDNQPIDLGNVNKFVEQIIPRRAYGWRDADIRGDIAGKGICLSSQYPRNLSDPTQKTRELKTVVSKDEKHRHFTRNKNL
uniref:LAGLIDADG homing endonuclease n=1 Tax=Romanomermis culicivorax TaxID=13658 RepID=A0A915K0U4_ROMCU